VILPSKFGLEHRFHGLMLAGRNRSFFVIAAAIRNS